MRSTYPSRSLFGCAGISLISAAVLVGTMLLPVKGTAQPTGNSQQPGSTPESPGMAEHAAMPTSLRELVREAEQKNPQIAASFHSWQASRSVPKQVSTLPETQLWVQQFSVGSPRLFAGYSNSDFAYIGFGASQDIPYPGKRQLRARVAENEAGSMEAQVDSIRRTVVGNLKIVYFQLAYIQQTLGVLQKSDELLNQVQQAAEARYRVGHGNQQDVLKAQLQHTKILQESPTTISKKGCSKLRSSNSWDVRRSRRTSLLRRSPFGPFRILRQNSCRRRARTIQMCAQRKPPPGSRTRK